MKPPRFLSLFTLLSLLSSVSAHADKLDDWYKLLPKNTVGVIAIKNTPELLADWDKSSFTKLLQDEEFKKWTAPMMKDGEAPWDKAVKEDSGEGLYDSLKRYPGASMAIFLGDSPEDFSGDEPPLCGLSDATGQEKGLEEMKLKEAEISMKKDESLKQRTQDIAGVTVHILAATEDAEEGWEDGYAFVDGTLVEANSLKDMQYFITALKSGAGEGSDVVAGHLTRLAQLTDGHTDVLVYLNGETLVQWGLQAATAAAAGGTSQMPISPETIIEVLGPQEIQSIALTLDIADDQSRIEMALLHPEKPTGFVSLLRSAGGEVVLPAFVPTDVISSTVTRYSLVGLWDKLMVMVNKLGPMAAMATMQLGGVEAQAGVKLRDDLFASLDDEYIEITDGSLENQSQVLAIKVKDHQRFGGALDGVKRFAGAGFAAFEETEYLGHQINVIKAAQPTGAEMAFCLTNDYFLFSTGPQALLKKVLSRMKEASGPSIWDDARVQDLIARLPKGYAGVGVADGGKMMKVVVDAMSMVQGQVGKTAKKKGKKGKGKKAPASEDEEALEAISGADTWFDPTAVPSDAMWKRYFGTSVSGYYSPANAIYYRSVTTPVEAQ
ncbi:hypothetical protein [Prosthecobacter dejongeii]|uniref:Uncharacterized protein n=1 Tax=Prosthecobacter dejongeii TaxID=48465 RepID=A0A7W7YI23_9BACT|nr:hypothetical protein [Prosthecobacter dejongeii]MBB5036270.1 hypothetical protein [Prosthecobacter dejongeii]